MKKFVKQLQPKDLIAILVLGGCFVLIALRIDSFVTIIMSTIIGYYFGRRSDFIKFNGK